MRRLPDFFCNKTMADLVFLFLRPMVGTMPCMVRENVRDGGLCQLMTWFVAGVNSKAGYGRISGVVLILWKTLGTYSWVSSQEFSLAHG